MIKFYLLQIIKPFFFEDCVTHISISINFNRNWKNILLFDDKDSSPWSEGVGAAIREKPIRYSISHIECNETDLDNQKIYYGLKKRILRRTER